MKAMIVLLTLLLAAPAWGAQILFLSNHEGSWEIYSMDERGKGIHRLTKNSAIDSHPRWSPDGSKIAFASGEEGKPRSIYVMDSDGANIRRLTNSPIGEYFPEWSPDGKRIAFGSNEIVYVMDAESGGIPWAVNDRSIFTYDLRFAWSPDGKEIAISVKLEDFQIMAIEVENPNHRRVLRNGKAWLGQWLKRGLLTRISKDGKQTFSVENHPFLPEKGNMQEVRWSPDEREVVFMVEKDIYYMEEGKSATRLTFNGTLNGTRYGLGGSIDIIGSSTRPVQPQQKLTTTWGALKTK